jgi:cobalamin transport system substrate-binding protein
MTRPGVAAALAPAARMKNAAALAPAARMKNAAALAPAARVKNAALAIVVLAACSRGHASLSAPGDARRIVSVSPATTEALFAVGAGDRVVGRSRFCDWPPEAAKVPTVGGVIDADFEAIVQLAPDLVIGSPGPASTRLSEKLAPFGIATWFPEVDSMAQIDAMIVGVGQRTGHAAEGREVAANVDARTAAVERSVAGESVPRVLMVLDADPVVATGPKDFIDEMLRLAGGQNVLAVGASWQTLDFEQIAALDPDVILDASAMTGGSGVSRIRPEAPGWTHVRAAREGHVVSVGDPRVLRPGPRTAEGLATLARALHPRAPVPTW